jgi:hypothetical protein
MKRFEFSVFKKVPGTKCTFMPITVVTEGTTFGEALAVLTAGHPGHCIAEHLKGLWRETEAYK